VSGDVRGFVHVCCCGAYREVTWEIIHALLESGLYDRSVSIELGVLGEVADQRAVEELIEPFKRFQIAYRSRDVTEYEFPTLDMLQRACETWPGAVYYLHTKGVSHSPHYQYARYWRRLMLDEVVGNHERCLAELATADAVGTNWRQNHYSGNFWWARASHVRRLPGIVALRRVPRRITADPIWNERLQCEFWLAMCRGRFVCVGYSGLDLYQELRWSTVASDVINELLTAGVGERFGELTNDGPSPYFDAVAAASKASVAYRSQDDGCREQDYLPVDSPNGGYDVIFVDTWHELKHTLDVIEGCLPKLNTNGALVVHDSNPPSEWHQRPAEGYEPGSQWNGAVWRAVVEFRIRHPQCEVFTVDTDWGCTVIRPNRPARQDPGVASSDRLDWAAFEQQRNRLLNLVSVEWFRRHLYADPYLTGNATLGSRTELLNVLISICGLDSYLEIGVAGGENLRQIIAPIRQSVDPDADATYQMTSDDFFASGVGLDCYDVIFIDGLHEQDQCERDLAHALFRLSDVGWILVHDVNPPTKWHQRLVGQFEPGSEWNGTVWKAVIRFHSAHPELELHTLDVDWGCALLRRRAAGMRPGRAGIMPGSLDLDWAFFDEHRRELLNLLPASATELRKLLC
jgi:predicted O-methyltransferase YrrM